VTKVEETHLQYSTDWLKTEILIDTLIILGKVSYMEYGFCIVENKIFVLWKPLTLKLFWYDTECV